MKTQEKSQLKIYIDSSQRDRKKVSLIKISGEKQKELDVIEGSVDVVGSIRKILQKNNLELKDISEFVPNLGPGSFTGLKIGVTVSNVLNWILGRKKLGELYIPEYGGEPNISERKKK
ncbi:MAG TPA: hypothetical protein PKH50_03220 [bacterium]|jgi:tRNA A37 threonylcarbamoyladenosine modification protein TsaB|nr:hypothetical protein [bacterium]